MPSNVYRITARERQQRLLDRSKPANVRRSPRRKQAQRLMFWKHWVAVLLLAPIALVTALTLVEMLWRATSQLAFWKTEEFIFFGVGGAAWAVGYATGWRPVRSYVFGHEMSHLVVARLFGGRIFDWKVTAEGGYVETNKSNTWITLAPYLLPFYSVIVLLVFGLAGLAWDMREVVGLAGVHLRPVWLFYALIGLTWSFHATYTAKTVLAEQSDLQRNGEFFSLMLIFLINVALLVGLFLMASPAPGLGVAEVWRCWTGTASSLVQLFTAFAD